MTNQLHLLHVEDNSADADLARDFLRTAGLDCQITHITTLETFRQELARTEFDLILSDFTLIGFDGFDVLAIARRESPQVPFIFLTGTMGEDLAVEAIKRGATDYILKDRLSRLPSSVERALREAREHAERQNMEEQLRRSEERFKFAAHATQDVVWDLDLATERVWRSDNFQKQFGFPNTADGGGLPWHYYIHPRDKQRVIAGVYAAIGSDIDLWSDEYRYLRADGSVANIFNRGHIIRNEQGKAVRMIGALMDITVRKQADERIREQAALLDQAQNAIFRTDIARQILYWNKGAERLYGWTAAEAIGTRADELLFPVELPATREPLQTLLTHGDWHGELHQVTRDRQNITVESHWTLMRDEAGEPKSILMISADVTKKRQMEARFFRNQRLESIGALAGGIAHDLNNALTPILMGMDLLRTERLSPAASHMVTLMSKSARHGADMVSQILSFSRGAAGQHTDVNVGGLVTEIVTLAQETFPRSIKIQAMVADGINSVVGNPTQLHQVLLNLFVNARDAMPRGGCLSIEAGTVALAVEDFPTGQAHIPGPYVRLNVSDTGHGIPPELMGRIFEPFFTTKANGNGTGLGLFTVTEIIKTHGGFLRVLSEVNRGTTFQIFLPAKLASRAPCTVPGIPQIVPGNGERILLVDDEIAILELTKLTLESFNYEVVTARNGAEGMEMYERHHDSISLIITDMMMPVMDGPELIRTIRARHPGLKIIGISGLGSGFLNQQRSDLLTDAFIKKPFSTEQLLKVIRWVLDPLPRTVQLSPDKTFSGNGKPSFRRREVPALP